MFIKSDENKEKFWTALHENVRSFLWMIESAVCIIIALILISMLVKSPLESSNEIDSLKTAAESVYQTHIPGTISRVEDINLGYEFEMTDTEIDAKCSKYFGTLKGVLNDDGEMSFEMTIGTSELLNIILKIVLCIIASFLAIYLIGDRILTFIDDQYIKYKYEKSNT